jgi:hypothetical protein
MAQSSLRQRLSNSDFDPSTGPPAPGADKKIQAANVAALDQRQTFDTVS